ncbi:MAG: DUF2520 domain-containing protein [Actinobacteria bacterium]|nr:DUF2520 domain-containing protein [Actinomycetota bacterium]
MTPATTFALIGAGRVATTLGVLLERAGHRIVAASGRSASRERVRRYLPQARFVPATEAARAGAVVVLGVVDDVIEPTCASLAEAGAFRVGQHVLHLSGSMGIATLSRAARAGAVTLSLHPLQSFPEVDEGLARMAGSGVAVTSSSEEGLLFGESLARDLGGVPFRVPDEVKPLYHAAAVFSANYLVVVEAAAERLLGRAGVPGPLELLRPLARTANERAFDLGPANALTGPAARGDVGAIHRNLAALSEAAPELVAAYRALAEVASDIATESGRLPAEQRLAVREELSRWS